LGAILERMLPVATPSITISAPPDAKSEQSPPPTKFLEAPPDPLSVALRAEVAEVERRDFPGGFPPLLARCVGHYLAGPNAAPAEGPAAWWAGARRQVMKIITRVKETRPPPWEVPQWPSVESLMIDRGADGPAVVDSAEWVTFCTFVRAFNAESREP
jgi:hypothetical protein